MVLLSQTRVRRRTSPRSTRTWFHNSGKKAHLSRHFVLKTIILPRQARNEHREGTQKRDAVLYTAPCSRPRCHTGTSLVSLYEHQTTGRLFAMEQTLSRFRTLVFVQVTTTPTRALSPAAAGRKVSEQKACPFYGLYLVYVRAVNFLSSLETQSFVKTGSGPNKHTHGKLNRRVI